LPEPRLINIIEWEDWSAPIMAYLHHYYKLDSTTKKIRMQQRARAYQIVDNNLYKAFISGPLLRCFSKAEGHDILSEVHVGICGGHISAHALAAKILRQGFYWTPMIDDVAKQVSTCKACQKFSHRSKSPAQPSQLIVPSWPLQRWASISSANSHSHKEITLSS
jgi:hypothetical protein